MSKKFYTSDLHFNSEFLIQEHLRPFRNVEKMNSTLIGNINRICNKDDILISCGDVCQFGNDRMYVGEKIRPEFFISQLNPVFVNVRGNHDDSNHVKSVCDSMRTTLGKKYVSVSVGHYPSTDIRSKGTFRKGDIRIHGHVHCRYGSDGSLILPPKYSIDFINKVLNINVNCELWNYNPISEDELIKFVDRIIRESKKTSIII